MQFKIQVNARVGEGREWKDVRPSGVQKPYTWPTRDAAEAVMRSLYPLQGPDVVRVVEA